MNELPHDAEKCCQFAATQWCRTFARLGMEREDIVQEARLCCIVCMDKFDPARGTMLTTFLHMKIFRRLCTLYRTNITQRRGGIDRPLALLDTDASDCGRAVEQAEAQAEAGILCSNDIIRGWFEAGFNAGEAAVAAGCSKSHYYRLLRRAVFSIRREQMHDHF